MLQKLPIHRSARFDPTGAYRYCLTRRWHHTHPGLTIIMLNPSQADGIKDDPTIRRCTALAHRWGFGSITVVNLFAYCTAHPRQLKQVEHPVGPENDQTLQNVAAGDADIWLAWGNWGSLYQRDEAVLELLMPFRHRLHCLGRNQTGQPQHPLYVSRTACLEPWG